MGDSCGLGDYTRVRWKLLSNDSECLRRSILKLPRRTQRDSLEGLMSSKASSRPVRLSSVEGGR